MMPVSITVHTHLPFIVKGRWVPNSVQEKEKEAWLVSNKLRQGIEPKWAYSVYPRASGTVGMWSTNGHYMCHFNTYVLLPSSGFLHSGYPIMGRTSIAEGMVDEVTIRSHGIWGVIHELGHNQQKGRWSFLPHTTEALCNLWDVYVHETVLNIHRNQAHPALNPDLRKQRIKNHLAKGAPLSNWVAWTALETYLQVLSEYSERREPPDFPVIPTSMHSACPSWIWEIGQGWHLAVGRAWYIWCG